MNVSNNNKAPRKLDNARFVRRFDKNALYSILILSMIFMAFFTVILFLDVREMEKGKEFYSMVSIDFVISPVISLGNELNTKHDYDSQVKEEPFIEEKGEEEEILFTPFVDFDMMREQFPDIIAWIQSEGAGINYPVVQGIDNEFYLYRLPDKSRNQMGSIFLDYHNSADFSDGNIFIYGHNVRSKDMFGMLLHYVNQEYFELYPSIFIFTPEQNLSIMLFAGYLLDSAYEVPPMYFVDSEDFDAYIADISSRSTFKSPIQISYGDRLVFLCTCPNVGSKSERFVIVGIANALEKRD